MSDVMMTIDEHIADLRARGLNRAADQLAATVSVTDVTEFVGETVTMSRVAGSASFESGVYRMFVADVTMGRNVNTGSARIDFKMNFVEDRNPRPVFTSLSLVGKNLDLVNKLGYRFGGQLLTDRFGADEIQVTDIFDAMHTMKGMTIEAWVREDEPNASGHIYLTSSPTTWRSVK